MRLNLPKLLAQPVLPHLRERIWRPLGGCPADSVGSIVLAVLMIVLFGFGIRKLGALRLTEAQFFLGLLLLVAVLMLGFALILLYQVLWNLKRRADAGDPTAG